MKNRKLEGILIGVVMTVFLLIAGCTTTKLVETPPGSGNYKKVVEVDPRLTTGLNTATGVNDVTGPINPWHGLVTLAIATIGGVAEWNRRRKQAQLDSVIAGVEAKGGSDVKEAIKNIAMANGVESALSKSVAKVTGG